MKESVNMKMLTCLAALLVGAAGTTLAGTTCGTNLKYEIVDSTLILTSPDPKSTATINSQAFINRTEFNKVVIPDNVTQIGSQAFMRCTALTDIDLGNVQDISSYAFDSCSALTEVVIPPTVTNIGVHAFYGCTSLQTVLCRPQNVPILGTDAFSNCTALQQICVTPTGSYNHATNWSNYTDIITSCYLDENDEQTIANSKILFFRTNFKTEIDIFRTLRKAGCFNTLTLPFNVPDIGSSPLAGAEVYTFTSATVENGTLLLDIAPLSGTALTAGTPYLIQWPNTGEVLNRMHFDGITWDNNEETDEAGTGDVQYIGFYGKTHIDDDTNHSNLFLAGGNELFWPEEGDVTSMLGFRAYFHIVTGGALSSPVRKGMPAALRIQSTPTGVENVQRNDVRCTKVLRNGQLYLMYDGAMYDVRGNKVKEGGLQ